MLNDNVKSWIVAALLNMLEDQVAVTGLQNVLEELVAVTIFGSRRLLAVRRLGQLSVTVTYTVILGFSCCFEASRTTPECLRVIENVRYRFTGRLHQDV